MLLNELIQEFLFDCKIRELSDSTVNNYRKQLAMFAKLYCKKWKTKRLYFVPYHGIISLRHIRISDSDF
jgi:hypothetical protein